ncbi:hypothetical protein ACFFX0_22605 [Citricoccus parietis]|uniref:Uncharacterized protein n=1 Tax=Citricoccus parietis TaxID=592307 RepID=A0ABV5G4H3_9MICC
MTRIRTAGTTCGSPPPAHSPRPPCCGPRSRRNWRRAAGWTASSPIW